MPETILTKGNTAFEGRRWYAVVYTPEAVEMPQRVVALLPIERQAFDLIDNTKAGTERLRVVSAWLNPSGSWTVRF